jgi:type VI protein secretion system component VasK
MSRRAAWTLIALCAWTLWVWITRVWIIAGQDQSMGFKVVHGILAAGSIAFGLAAGWIGYRRLRPARSSALAADPSPREAAAVGERSTPS